MLWLLLWRFGPCRDEREVAGHVLPTARDPTGRFAERLCLPVRLERSGNAATRSSAAHSSG
jgi:hypothetical protein